MEFKSKKILPNYDFYYNFVPKYAILFVDSVKTIAAIYIFYDI